MQTFTMERGAIDMLAGPIGTLAAGTACEENAGQIISTGRSFTTDSVRFVPGMGDRRRSKTSTTQWGARRPRICSRILAQGVRTGYLDFAGACSTS